MAINRIINRAFKRIVPTKKERQEMNLFVKRLLQTASGTNYTPIVCGSVGKDTWLSHRKEVDLFLLYFPELDNEHLEKTGLKDAKKIVSTLKGKYKLTYSEHPYLQASFRFKGKIYEVDIVPAFDVPDPSKIKSSVDRTPHHVRYVKNNMRTKMKNEIRLLKQFCIAHDCYGADLKTLGFSGYLCELLILKYGSFNSLCKAASKWYAGIKLTLNKPTKNFSTPLIFIDPVDPNRNVAAVVSEDKFHEFIEACKKFRKTPSIYHFFPKAIKPITQTKLKKNLSARGTELLILKFKKPKALDDIIWAQKRKAMRMIERILAEGGFASITKMSWLGKNICVLVFEMANWKVPSVKKHKGPYIYSRKQSNAFIKHYLGNPIYIEDSRWVVELERRYTKVSPYLKKYFSQSPEKLRLKGIPSKLAPAMHRCKINISPKINSFPKDFRISLNKHFQKNKV